MAYIKELPAIPLPEVFGMHDNVDISKELKETRTLQEACLLAQAQLAAGSSNGDGKSPEQVRLVYVLIINIVVVIIITIIVVVVVIYLFSLLSSCLFLFNVCVSACGEK